MVNNPIPDAKAYGEKFSVCRTALITKASGSSVGVLMGEGRIVMSCVLGRTTIPILMGMCESIVLY